MKVRDFTGGLNTYDIPENLKDNEFSSLLNVCYDEGAILRSRYGFTKVFSATTPNKIYPYYIGSTLHMIYTATRGLFDGASLLCASFKGTFSADEFAHLLYLTNGTYFKRYDGSIVGPITDGLTPVGVAAPSTPTVTTQPWHSTQLENFDTTPVEFVMSAAPFNGGTGAAVARDTAVKLEGTASVRVTCFMNCGAVATKTYGSAQNWAQFSPGVLSSDKDFIVLRVKAYDASHIEYLRVEFDINDGTFKDTFTTPEVVPGEMYESKMLTTMPTIISQLTGTSTIPGTSMITTTDGISMIYWFKGTEEWQTFIVPKCDFKRIGNTAAKGWDTVKKMRVIYNAKVPIVHGYPSGTGSYGCLWFDDLRLEGAGGAYEGLIGNFAFCASYYNSVRDEYYEVSPEGDYVECATQNLHITGIPASYPAQANKYLVWCRAEADDHWYLIYSKGATYVNATINTDIATLITQPDLYERSGMSPMPRTLPGGEIISDGTSNNAPPPVCDTLCMHRGKMFYGKNDRIYHSKTGMPYAVPTDSYIEATSLSDPIVGFYSDGNNLQVFSKSSDYNYVFAGEYQSGWVYMGYLAKGRTTAGCVSQHTISQGTHCSSQGIALFDGGDSRILSNKVKPTFRAITSKQDLQGVVWDNLYIVVNPNGNTLVMDRTADGEIRFYEWSFKKKSYSCMVDPRFDQLYIGLKDGIYAYDLTKYQDQATPTGGYRLAFNAVSKNHEFAEEDKDLPLERFMVQTSTGGATLRANFSIDKVRHGVGVLRTAATSSAFEKEGLLDMGAIGSFVRVSMAATVAASFPIRIYAIEVS